MSDGDGDRYDHQLQRYWHHSLLDSDSSKTGCSESVTASTTTLSCKAAPTNPAKRQAGGQGGQDACAEVKEWLVWPEDGMDKAQTGAISSKLKEILVDEHKIVVSDTKFAGVNFWIVTLEAGQEAEIKKIEHVRASR